MSLTLPPVDRDALVATRRDLHQHPELGFQETRTSTLVAERLQSLGYQGKTGVGQTGVVAVKWGGGGGGGGGQGKGLTRRADRDRRPDAGANELPYEWPDPGRMHAAG